MLPYPSHTVRNPNAAPKLIPWTKPQAMTVQYTLAKCVRAEGGGPFAAKVHRAKKVNTSFKSRPWEKCKPPHASYTKARVMNSILISIWIIRTFDSGLWRWRDPKAGFPDLFSWIVWLGRTLQMCIRRGPGTSMAERWWSHSDTQIYEQYVGEDGQAMYGGRGEHAESCRRGRRSCTRI